MRNTWVFIVALAAIVFGAFFVKRTADYSTNRQRAKELALKYATTSLEALKVFTLFQTENAQFDASSTAFDGKSYGLGQITPFWIRALTGLTPADPIAWLKDADNNAKLTVKIVRYFQGRGFSFPAQADIYNVGETLWSKGTRNTSYRSRYLTNWNNNRKEFGA